MTQKDISRIGATILFLFSVLSLGFTQSLPIDFESAVTTADFVNFDGGTATVIANPQSSGINTSTTVAQIVRDGGQVWAGSKIQLAANLDFTTMSSISMKVYTSAPAGTTVKFKLEGTGETERDVVTTVSNEWEVLTWDFTGAPSNFDYVVFMFDFGNVGNGSMNSTFLFDDVEQISQGTQIDLPVDFEGETVNHTTTDFGGTVSSRGPDPENSENYVIQVIKTSTAATWGGTTIGTSAGFKSDIPLSLSESIVTLKVWSPDANIPVRLKVEDSNDPTHTCETEVMTTVAGEWEALRFDFTNQATGTESLEVGLNMGWTYNMASIFFNFDTDGATAGEKIYYFDDISFGAIALSASIPEIEDLEVFPNPSENYWTISSAAEKLTTITLHDLQGRLLLTLRPDGHSVRIDNSGLGEGMYLSKISTRSGVSNVKLLKK